MTDLPPNVTAFRDQYGKTRYRFRKRGFPSRALPGEPGSEAFEAAYAEAIAGIPSLKHRGVVRPAIAPRTLRAAWVEVQRTVEWHQLRPSSKKHQLGVAERFLAMPIAPGESTTFADMPFAGIRRGDIKKILARFADRPHAGSCVLHLMRKLAITALDLEWIEADPTHRIKFRPPIIGHRAWTDAELVTFAGKHPIGTPERLGFALALYTGQRRADVAAMRWSAYVDGGIAVRQEKTGAVLWIPAHPDLRAILDQTERRGEAIMWHRLEGPYQPNAFGNMMARAIAAAGLPDACRLHGLRKSAGRCLAEAGATTRQIMAVLGHKTLSEAERYTREVEQRRLAVAGIEQWAKPRLSVVNGGRDG